MDSSILAFKIPPDLARRLELPMSDAEDAADLHITLMMLGQPPASKREALEALLESWTASHSAISGTLGGIARFAPTPGSDSKEPLVVLFDSPDLPAWREGLFKQVDNLLDLKAEQTHGFTPHITIKYLSPDEGNPIQQIKREEVIFPSLWLFWNDEQIEFSLTGSKKESAPMNEATQRDLGNVAELLSDLGIRISKLQRNAEPSQKSLLTDVLNLIIKAGDVLTGIPARESTGHESKTNRSEAIDPLSDLMRRLRSCADDLIRLRRDPNFESRASDLGLAAQSVRAALTYIGGGTPESVRSTEGIRQDLAVLYNDSMDLTHAVDQVAASYRSAAPSVARSLNMISMKLDEVVSAFEKLTGQSGLESRSREADSSVNGMLRAVVKVKQLVDEASFSLPGTADDPKVIVALDKIESDFSRLITDIVALRKLLQSLAYPEGSAESVRESTLTGSQKATIKGKIDSAVRSTLDAMIDLEADPSQSALKATLDRAAKMLQSVSARGIESIQEYKAEYLDVNFYRQSLEDRADEIQAITSKLLKIERIIAMYRGDSSSAVGNLVEAQGHLGSARDLVTDASTSLETPEEPYEESVQSPLRHFVEAGILKPRTVEYEGLDLLGEAARSVLINHRAGLSLDALARAVSDELNEKVNPADLKMAIEKYEKRTITLDKSQIYRFVSR